MTAFNAVRFRVKPGREEDFLEANKKTERNCIFARPCKPKTGAFAGVFSIGREFDYRVS